MKDIPDPDPELERQSFIIAEGFEVNLFAADPLLAKPIHMNFDAQGRLWVASSEVYPHIKPGQPATDKILVLEDADADGTADKTSVFAGGLLIPTGVLPGDGGVYVANSTELIHLKDTDGDGRADRRRIVLSGFGTEDTHHLLHTLRWGHDGAMYMNQSIYIHSHVETPYGVKHLNGGGIWRFRPETMELEILCRGFVNSWGHHFDRWGQSFATDGAYGEGINYVFPGSVFVTAPGATRRVQGLNPGSPKHCGLEIVSGRHLPPEWQGNMITNDFRAHRVCRFVTSEDGSAYASRQETELIKTKHVAFRPIDVKVGPDGAIYIADWYNPIIQHGEVDFRDPRRDHVHGRIWRVTAKGRATLPRPKLVDASTTELLDQLKSPEEFTRLHAKLILKSRGAAEVAGALATWLIELDEKDPDCEHHRLEGLWLYESLREVNEKLLNELLQSNDHRVRAAAVRVASHWREALENPLAIARVAVVDEHPRVRLEAVRMLAEFRDAEGTAAARFALQALDRSMDRFLDFALWQAMRDLAPFWLPAVRRGQTDFDGNVDHLTFALRAVDSPEVVEPLLALVKANKIPADRLGEVLALISSLGGPRELGQVLDTVLDGKSLDEARRAPLLTALVTAAQQRKIRPAGDLGRLSKLVDSENLPLRAAALRAAGAWRQESMRDAITKTAMSGRDTSPGVVRYAAYDALASLGDGASKQTLAKIAGGSLPVADRQQAVTALAGVDPKLAAQHAVEILSAAPDGLSVDSLLGAILAQNTGPGALAAALRGKQLEADVAKLGVSAVQRSARPAPALIEALRNAGKLTEAGWKLTPQLLAELVAEVAKEGDPHRGQAIYRRAALQCMKCHAVGGAGGKVGPDLVSVGASAQVDYLIESLIVPNAKVKENFHSQQVQTDEGKVLSGIPVRETKTELVLRDAEDREVTIPIDSIDARKDGRSLMPDGTVDTLTRGELVDLVRFLSELGKVGEFAIGNARDVRRWQMLVWTPEGNRRLNRSSYDTAATDDPALTWAPAYSRVEGDLPIDGLPKFVIHRGNDPTGFLRFEVDVTTAGKITLRFDSPTGLALWVDGKPTPLANSDMTFDLATCRHRFTLAVNQVKRSAPLRVELIDTPNSAAQAQLVGGK